MATSDRNSDDGVILQASGKRQIVRFGDIVVKSGPDLKPNEADTMIFKAQNTNIPVPRVLKYSSGPNPSIAMEYNDGKRLDRVWNGLTEDLELDLARQLRVILTELQALKCDGDEFIGAVGRGEAVDWRRDISI